MKQAGVWSFRTRTGVARVVNGRLRARHTLYGLTVGTYRRDGWKAVLKHLVIGFGGFSVFGPVTDLLRAVVSEGSLTAASVGGVFSLIALVGTIATLCVPVLNRTFAPVDIYDIVDVAVDTADCELTIQHTDNGSDRETTTVKLADEEALGEAVSVLSLKGAPVNEAIVEKWG